jgi:hypothetical protein
MSADPHPSVVRTGGNDFHALRRRRQIDADADMHAGGGGRRRQRGRKRYGRREPKKTFARHANALQKNRANHIMGAGERR